MRPAVLAFASCAAFAACSWTDPDPGWADRNAQVVDAQAFVSSTTELRGIDPPAPAHRVEKGDRILYGVEFEKGDEKRNWLVYVEVEDPEFEPRKTRYGTTRYLLRLAVRVCDENGAEVGRDVVTVSRDDLVFGLFRACRGEEQPAEAVPDGVLVSEDGVVVPFARIPTDVSAGLALANMLSVVRKSKVLYDVLWAVLDKPSIFSVIVNLGVRVSVQEYFDKVRVIEPMAIDGQEFPTYELPVELRLNDRPALRSVVLVTEPRSPLNLSAGILGVDAFQPSDPSARVSIRVLAARRGSATRP